MITFVAHADEPTTSYQDKTYQVALVKGDVGSQVVFDELEKHFQFQVNYVYFRNFSQILEALKKNTIDFAPNVTYSTEREKYFDISEPTNMEYTYLYTLPTFSEQNTFRDVRVVAVANNLIFKSFIEKNYSNIRVLNFSNYQQALTMLKRGEVDGVIDGISKLRRFLDDGMNARMLNSILPIQSVGIATPKGQHAEAVKAMVSYLHTPEIQKALRQKTERFQYEYQLNSIKQQVARLHLNHKKKLQVKLENVHVFSKYDKEGELQGISIDILNEICEILEFECEVVSTADETWQSMYADLLNNKIDVLGPIFISPSRKDKMYFSLPYFTPETVVVKRTGYKEGVYKSLSEMVIERISVVDGDYYDGLLTDMLPSKKLYRMSDRTQQIQALRDGKVDYIILNRQNYTQMLLDESAGFDTEEDQYIGVFHKTPVSFAFPKTDDGYKLSKAFNLAQNLVDIPHIVKSYYVVPNWRLVLQKEQHLHHMIWAIFLISLVCMSFVLWMIYQQSVTDNLTRLKNRRALYQKFSRGIPADYTLVYLDVNRFKMINDTHGHRCGDTVLKDLASSILNHWNGHSFRIGGDEFILLARIDNKKLQSILSKFKSLEIGLENGDIIEVTTSCGISANRKQVMNVDQVLHLADEKMYLDKAASR